MSNIDKDIISNFSLLSKLITKYNFKNTNRLHNKGKCIKIKNEIDFHRRQFDILYLIVTKKCKTVSDISSELDLSKSSLSITVSKMVEQNLLEKVYEQTLDSRQVMLQETEKGKKLFINIKQFFKEDMIDFYNWLSESQKEIYKSAIQSLNVAFLSFGLKKIDLEQSNEQIVEKMFENIFILKKPLEKLYRQVKNNLKDEIVLTEKQIDILLYIKEYNKNIPSELASILFSSESTISSQLKTLVEKKYLVKEKSKEDSRKTYFNITDLGVTTLDICRSKLEKQLLGIISKFSEQEKENLLEGSTNLIKLFELLTQI